MSEQTDTYGFEAELEGGVITLCDSLGGGTRIWAVEGSVEAKIAAYIRDKASMIAESMVEDLGLEDVDDDEDDD